MKYFFDIDGTLTPSRGVMDKGFQSFFNEFCEANEVYLITGSDRAKTLEQIGEETYNLCKKVYQCSGNDVWVQDKNVHTNTWTPNPTVVEWLEDKLAKSQFTVRTGRHIEYRPGMINYSTVGRNAGTSEREQYRIFDDIVEERKYLAKEFNETFTFLDCRIGGVTGLDISPKGYDKSQVVKEHGNEITFFGDDMTHEEGNDYTLGLLVNHPVPVDNWQDTYYKLTEIMVSKDLKFMTAKEYYT